MTETEKTEVTTIRGGLVVAAKIDPKYGLCAIKYTNRKQADARRDKLRAVGVECEVIQPQLGPVFFIRVGA